MGQKLKLELKNNSIQGIKLTLGGATKELDAETVSGMISHLKMWMSWREHWSNEVERYKGYSLDRIKSNLDNQEQSFDDDDKEYRIGDEFASYLQTASKNGMMADNNQAAKIIRKDWKKEFPEYEKDIIIDAEMSFCYVYTKKRDVAEKFLWWSYNKYKKPTIDLIINEIEK